jgi:hypothetical protein
MVRGVLKGLLLPTHDKKYNILWVPNAAQKGQNLTLLVSFLQNETTATHVENWQLPKKLIPFEVHQQ